MIVYVYIYMCVYPNIYSIYIYICVYTYCSNLFIYLVAPGAIYLPRLYISVSFPYTWEEV